MRIHMPPNFRRLRAQQPNQLLRIDHGNEAIARKQLDENQQDASYLTHVRGHRSEGKKHILGLSLRRVKLEALCGVEHVVPRCLSALDRLLFPKCDSSRRDANFCAPL